MAVIKKLDEIIDLIPEPDTRLYGSNITEAPSHIVDNHPLYAILVNNNLNLVTGIRKASFILVKRDISYYLMIVDYYQETDHTTEYLTLPYKEDKKLEKTDWGFESDDIGLKMISEGYSGCTIYFVTIPEDIKEIKEKIKARKEIKIVELEPVIV